MKYSLKDRIANEKPTVEITDTLTVTVNNSFNKVLAMQEGLSATDGKTNAEKMRGVLLSLLDKKDVQAIEKLDLPFDEFVLVVKTIIAAATGQPLSVIEDRFQS